MYIASDDLIGGHGDHYFMYYVLVGKSNLRACALFWVYKAFFLNL